MRIYALLSKDPGSSVIKNNSRPQPPKKPQKEPQKPPKEPPTPPTPPTEVP